MTGGSKVQSQTPQGSMVEAAINVVVGYGVAVCSQIIIFPLFDVHIPLADDLMIGLWFAAISLARSYIIRRWFNDMARNAANKITGARQ
jgi:hypothetical protein